MIIRREYQIKKPNGLISLMA